MQCRHTLINVQFSWMDLFITCCVFPNLIGRGTQMTTYTVYAALVFVDKVLPAWGEGQRWSQNPGSSQPLGHVENMPSSHWINSPVPVHLSPWRSHVLDMCVLYRVGSPFHMLKLPWYSQHTASWQGSHVRHTVAATRCRGSGEELPSEQVPAQGDTVVSFTYDIKGYKHMQDSTQINSSYILHQCCQWNSLLYTCPQFYV